MSQDWTAGFWRARHPVHARQEMPGIEVAEGVFAVVSEPGHFSGERGESGFERCGAVGEAGVGGSEGRISSARRDFHRGGGAGAAEEEKIEPELADRRLRTEVRGLVRSPDRALAIGLL